VLRPQQEVTHATLCDISAVTALLFGFALLDNVHTENRLRLNTTCFTNMTGTRITRHSQVAALKDCAAGAHVIQTRDSSAARYGCGRCVTPPTTRSSSLTRYRRRLPTASLMRGRCIRPPSPCTTPSTCRSLSLRFTVNRLA